jgi:chemotaxis protein CheD
MSQFEQELVTIHPGEYYATADDTIIATVLGSCVSVALYDEAARIGGLNHFMLAWDYRKDGIVGSPDAKYGMYAMELLVNDLLKLGARRSALSAKVFGGGQVLHVEMGVGARVSETNIKFGFEYLHEEGIPIVSSDVGGTEPRKIFLFARTGKVLLKRIGDRDADLERLEEERYLQSLRRNAPEGPIVMFKEPKGR